MWTPRFNAQFIRPVRSNLRATIEAHEAEALQWANDGTPMEAFKIYRNALWYNTVRPVCSVVSQRTDLTFSDDFSRLEQVHKIYVEIEDQGPDPDALAESVERRVQAVDMIVRSATLPELMGALNPKYAMLITVDVSDHNYVQFLRQKSIYLQIGSMTVTIEAIETINA